LAEKIRSEFQEGRVFLFLDEVQEWEDWDARLRWLHDVKDFKLVVSGSSSALLSSEIPSRLRGRHSSTLLLPLSFAELVGEVKNDFRSTGRAKGVLEEYMKWGGFPDVWLHKSRERLVDALNAMFYRDAVERGSIRNVAEFREVFNYLLSSYSNPLTWNSLRKVMRHQGVELNVKTIMNYAEYMREAYLIFFTSRFSHSQRLISSLPRKVYVVDPGIASLFDQGMDEGRKLENVVFLELLRRGWEVWYYRVDEEGEIDFLVKKGERNALIEVSLEIDDSHVKRLRRGMDSLHLREEILITLNEEDRDGIRIVPAWKWLAKD